MTIQTGIDAAPVRGNLDDLDYRQFRARVAGRLAGAAALPLFTTDVDLWPIYLEAFPPETRQFHNCSACRHFLRRFGALAAISERGEVSSAIWGPTDADADHAAAVAAMAAAVRRAKITGVFLSGSSELGREVTGAWAHLAARLPAASRAFGRPLHMTPGQAMAELRQDHANVMRALDEFPLALLERIVELLKADALYRAEHVLGPAVWLRDLAAAGGSSRANLVWRAVATAPAGFCHPRSSMIGTLLLDCAGGMAFDGAARRFKDKMHPLQYQRPQAARSLEN
jgi:hypothetical protein